MPVKAQPEPVRKPERYRTVTDLELNQAKYAVRLASMFSEWVHRRVETIEFPDADTVRRRMSVDFTLSEEMISKRFEASVFDENDEVLVPVMILKKRNLRNFDLRDANGQALPMLTTKENGVIARVGLEDWLWPGAPDGLTEALQRAVEQPDPTKAAVAAARELSEGGALRAAIENLPTDEPTRRAFQALIKELSIGFLLLVPMPYRPGERTVIKFTYDATTNDDDWLDIQSLTAEDRVAIEEVLEIGQRRWSERQYRRIRRLFSETGLSARLEDIEDVQLGWSESYHVELVPPTDMEFAETALEPHGERPIRDSNNFRPHLHVDQRPRDSRGQITAALHAQRSALVFPLAFAAIIIAAVLAVLPHRLSGADPQTIAALLVLPFALAAYYVRNSEHSYVRGSMRVLRAIAALSVIVGLFVLAMVGLDYLSVDASGDPSDPTAVKVAEWAARLAVLLALILALASITPLLGKIARKLIHRAEDRLESSSERAQRFWGYCLLIALGGGYLAILATALWTLYSFLSI